MPVKPDDWNELFGVWFPVRPDPLTDTGSVLVTVHRHGTDLWFHVQGPNAGLTVQTIAPDTVDFRSTDQECP